MPLPTVTERQNIRIEAVGDPDDSATLADRLIDYYWQDEGAGSVLLTAALCCDALANNAARNFTFTADGQTMNMAQRQAQYRQNATWLRERYYGSGAITVSRPTVTTAEFSS